MVSQFTGAMGIVDLVIPLSISSDSSKNDTDDSRELMFLRASLIAAVSLNATPATAAAVAEAIAAGAIPLERLYVPNARAALVGFSEVYLNDTWVAVTEDPAALADVVRQMRRELRVQETVGVTWNIWRNTVHIRTDRGRVFANPARLAARGYDIKGLRADEGLENSKLDARGMPSENAFIADRDPIVGKVEVRSRKDRVGGEDEYRDVSERLNLTGRARGYFVDRVFSDRYISEFDADEGTRSSWWTLPTDVEVPASEVVVETPYAFKLLRQELQTMGIDSRLIFKDPEDPFASTDTVDVPDAPMVTNLANTTDGDYTHKALTTKTSLVTPKPPKTTTIPSDTTKSLQSIDIPKISKTLTSTDTTAIPTATTKALKSTDTPKPKPPKTTDIPPSTTKALKSIDIAKISKTLTSTDTPKAPKTTAIPTATTKALKSTDTPKPKPPKTTDIPTDTSQDCNNH
eukprot:gene29459-5804_t